MFPSTVRQKLLEALQKDAIEGAASTVAITILTIGGLKNGLLTTVPRTFRQ